MPALEHILARLRTLSGPALWLWLLLAIAGTFYFLRTTLATKSDNAVIAALNGGEDREIDAGSASDAVVLARLNELLRRDRFDEAQALANGTAGRSAPSYRVKAIYNLANDRVRRAVAAIGKGDFDGATALVNVAKSEYRIALRMEPDNWDLKHNLDVAMRIVRDLPLSDSDPQEVPPDAPTRVWTDLPGVPKGLP